MIRAFLVVFAIILLVFCKSSENTATNASPLESILLQLNHLGFNTGRLPRGGLLVNTENVELPKSFDFGYDCEYFESTDWKFILNYNPEVFYFSEFARGLSYIFSDSTNTITINELKREFGEPVSYSQNVSGEVTALEYCVFLTQENTTLFKSPNDCQSRLFFNFKNNNFSGIVLAGGWPCHSFSTVLHQVSLYDGSIIK